MSLYAVSDVLSPVPVQPPRISFSDALAALSNLVEVAAEIVELGRLLALVRTAATFLVASVLNLLGVAR